MRIELSEQAGGFIRNLAPEPRRRIRDALKRLAKGRGDIEPLEAEWEGFYRLRIGRHRIIFWYVDVRGEPLIRCEFAEARSIIYQVHAAAARILRG